MTQADRRIARRPLVLRLLLPAPRLLGTLRVAEKHSIRPRTCGYRVRCIAPPRIARVLRLRMARPAVPRRHRLAELIRPRLPPKGGRALSASTSLSNSAKRP